MSSGKAQLQEQEEGVRVQQKEVLIEYGSRKQSSGKALILSPVLLAQQKCHTCAPPIVSLLSHPDRSACCLRPSSEVGMGENSRLLKRPVILPASSHPVLCILCLIPLLLRMPAAASCWPLPQCRSKPDPPSHLPSAVETQNNPLVSCAHPRDCTPAFGCKPQAAASCLSEVSKYFFLHPSILPLCIPLHYITLRDFSLKRWLRVLLFSWFQLKTDGD